jgi:hypothetical protein
VDPTQALAPSYCRSEECKQLYEVDLPLADLVNESVNDRGDTWSEALHGTCGESLAREGAKATVCLFDRQGGLLKRWIAGFRRHRGLFKFPVMRGPEKARVLVGAAGLPVTPVTPVDFVCVPTTFAVSLSRSGYAGSIQSASSPREPR